jgi:hypothetical protein
LVSFDKRLKDDVISLAQPKRDLLRIALHERPRSQLVIEHTWCIRNTVAELRKGRKSGNRELEARFLPDKQYFLEGWSARKFLAIDVETTERPKDASFCLSKEVVGKRTTKTKRPER